MELANDQKEFKVGDLCRHIGTGEFVVIKDFNHEMVLVMDTYRNLMWYADISKLKHLSSLEKELL
jgi:hypothetical protein